ncbi:protein TonB [Paraburkholderia sp. GAS333]|uniref:energy transducer TonB n=1 Tax=Paraburkholderia sp. GAS333 TaxID=3156279 RepID=UPI003D2212DE
MNPEMARRRELFSRTVRRIFNWLRTMLQAVMANPARHPMPAPRYRRGVIVLGAVIGAHLLLLLLATSMHDNVIERPVEPVTITAMLLSPEPESTAPVAAVAPATRPAAQIPVPARAVPKMPAHMPTQMPALPRAHASRSTAIAAAAGRSAPTDHPPSTTAAATDTSAAASAPTTVASASPSAAAAAPPSPAAERAVATSSAPRNVAHIDCRIPAPDYPDPSKRRRENGTAIVRFVVGTNGRIETMQLQKSSGYPRLDDAALAAVHEGVCEPYSENGVPVRAAYSQAFVFGLTD